MTHLNTNFRAEVYNEYYGTPTLKLEVPLNDYYLIPRNSWVYPDLASQLLHNTMAPAIYTTVQCLWYLHNINYTYTKSFCKAANHDDQTSLLWFLTYGDTLPEDPTKFKFLPVEFNA